MRFKENLHLQLILVPLIATLTQIFQSVSLARTVFLSALLFALLSIPAFADESVFPSDGRATLSSTLSNYGIVSGDVMHSLYGNHEGFLYGNLMGDYSNDDSFVASPGFGIRTLQSNQIFGAHLYTDYARTRSGQKFLTVSPGIEWMNTRWDTSVNLYLPTERVKQSGAAFPGGVAFETGTHNQYDTVLTPYTVIGNGMDVAAGYSFAGYRDLRSRVYGGAYYYDTPLDARNIAGLTAGVELPLSNRFKISLSNSYDKIGKYTVGFKVALSVGADTTTMSDNVHDRAADPVQRHIGIIGTGAGTIAQQAVKEQRTLQYDDVYFLSPTGNGNGTFGNAAGLNQTTLNLANVQNPSGSRIYLQGGATANYAVNSTTAGQSTNPNNDFGLVLHDHQDVFGRSADYKTAVAGNAQPQILVDGLNNYNGFILGGTQNTLSDLTIRSNAGYINGSVPTTSTGIVAYNESAGNQTITLTNTNISGLADGMYAQNDSATGTLTINATRSSFNNNGGDSGLDNIQVTGYNNYGASGLIAINNSGSSNALIINADHSQFNNNGTLSGSGSNINNNNFSVASGMTAINNSDTGALTINAASSTFDGNGTLSGLNTYILASETGANFNSINTAAATGLFARNNTTNNAALNINANASTFNNNGTLSGDNSTLQAGGNSSGDNVNSAVASGVFAFNNSANGALNITALNSEFNGNGALSGTGSTILGFADNASLGASETSAAATGVFAFNNTMGTGTITVNATGSQFNDNGALTGENASITAHTTDINNSNETVASNASGMFAYNANNQGSSNGAITITADNSTFNGNGALSGNSTVIQALNDNGFATGSASLATATGLSGYNTAAGPLTFSATNSLFNNSGVSTGTGSTIVASGADSNPSAASGFFVLNNSAVSGNIFANSFAGSSFTGNGAGSTGYGLYAYTPSIVGTTVINYTGAAFTGAPQINTNQGISDGTTQWVQ